MSPTPIVYVVDADFSMRQSLEVLIRTAGWHAETFASAREFLSHGGDEDAEKTMRQERKDRGAQVVGAYEDREARRGAGRMISGGTEVDATKELLDPRASVKPKGERKVADLIELFSNYDK